MHKLLKNLDKIPENLVGHLKMFQNLTTKEKTSFMLNTELRNEFLEDCDFCGGYFIQTPNKTTIQKRLNNLKNRLPV